MVGRRSFGLAGVGLVGVAGIVLLVGWLVVFPGRGSGAASGQGGVQRMAVNYQENELSTTVSSSSNGELIYNKTISFAPSSSPLPNVVMITISGQSDVHNGARLRLSCHFDAGSCNPSGWVSAMRHPNYNLYYSGAGFPGDCGSCGSGAGDLHDNSVVASWCVNPGPGTSHSVQLRMASDSTPDSGSAGKHVYMEKIMFTIDAASVPAGDACSNDRGLGVIGPDTAASAQGK